MAFKMKGYSPFTKTVTKSFAGRKYKATKSGIPLPEKTEWSKKTQEEKAAWRKKQTADAPKKGQSVFSMTGDTYQASKGARSRRQASDAKKLARQKRMGG